MMQTPDAEISLHVSVARQELTVRDGKGTLIHRFPVSTSRFGLGTTPGSLCTPLGMFRIAEKFGTGEPLGTIFKSRVSTGENGLNASDDDLVLTRILWLKGEEEANANTYKRYIYIHGTNHEAEIGQPASHGCIRMLNADVAELFDLVPVRCPVEIDVS